jgi:hypothetical protein
MTFMFSAAGGWNNGKRTHLHVSRDEIKSNLKRCSCQRAAGGSEVFCRCLSGNVRREHYAHRQHCSMGKLKRRHAGI